ncbi:MAG: GAF domain-containing protein, partial [Anaerolineae bacterium]
MLAKQTRELSTVALVSTTAATILDPAQLLQEVVDLTKTSFDLYHAHVHLLNDTRDTLVLTAGAGEIGQKMVAEGRRIPLAAKGSLVATVARTNQGAIRNYDPPGEGFMPHPLLAETSCEMAVPISIGDEVMGVLDVRSTELNYFGEADMQIYTALAAQVAVALQNARSFARSEQALKELSELSRRLTHEGWESYLKQMDQDFQFAYDLRQVIKGKSENGSPETADPALVQPIAVLGEPIGQISLVEPRALADDAAEIMDAVANRLSAHIENLRLTAQTEQALSETAEQARRRAVLNQTSEKLNRAENLDDIFQIIADGTAQILPSDRVSLALLNETGDHFSVMSLAGAEENVPVRIDQPLAGSFIEKVVKTGTVLVTHDGQPNPKTGICSSMVAPLITGSGTIGTLNVGSKEDDVYTEPDQGLILQIASILSSVIENKRLLTETQERARELAMINRVVAEVSASLDIQQGLQIVADELAQATNIEAIAIALINDDQASLTVVAEHYNPEHAGSSLGFVIPIEGNALTQEVLNTRRTVLVEDAQNNPLTEPVHEGMRMRGVNTLYIIPMFAGNEIIGTVGIDIVEKDRRLSPQ